MASETASSADEENIVVSVAGTGTGGETDKRGKHRILAELKRLDQETKFLQEELEELEKTENVSAICMDIQSGKEVALQRPDRGLMSYQLNLHEDEIEIFLAELL
ncbi:guanine nucleotide-binding protein subunit gamma 1-like isoform [Sesbania bispinosa]|nr:guanine nucleotide-binding protein subunit gamma 1-like isoform [Sesbania bispinosa]